MASISFTAPNYPDVRGIEVWSALTNDTGVSVRRFGPLYGAPAATFTVQDDLIGGAVRYYWARTVAPFDALSGFSATLTAAKPALIRPGYLDAAFTLTRAQASGAKSTALASDGVTWTEYAADAPRYNGADEWLIIEGQRTNDLPNPRCEGGTVGVIGAGGVMPTGMSVGGTASGLTVEIISFGAVNGVDCMTLDFSGTATSSADIAVNLSATTAIVAAPSQSRAASVFARLDAATLPANSHELRVMPRTAAGAIVSGTAVNVAFVPTGTLTRVVNEITAISSGGTIARINTQYIAKVTNGNAYAWRITLGWPTNEQAAFCSTPILPAIGTPAASTRSGEVISAPLADLGVTGTCSVSVVARRPADATTADQMLFQLDDGTNDNRIRLRNTAGGAAIVAGRVTAAASSDATTLGSMTPGTPFAVLLTLDGSQRVAASMDGGTVRTASGGPSGLTTLRVGNQVVSGAPLFGEIGRLDVISAVLADADLPTLGAVLE